MVDLCFVHLKEAQKAVKEMETLRQIEAKLPDQPDLLSWSKDGEETEATF